MFARTVPMPQMARSKSDFAQAIERGLIPLLRNHGGFSDQIAPVSADGKTAVGIGVGGTRDNAEAYHRSGYGAVTNDLEAVINGTAKVQLREITNCTAHKIAAAARA